MLQEIQEAPGHACKARICLKICCTVEGVHPPPLQYRPDLPPTDIGCLCSVQFQFMCNKTLQWVFNCIGEANLRHQRKQKKAFSADGKEGKSSLYKRSVYKDSCGGERFGSDFSPVHIIGVSIARLMALRFWIQCARLFIASAERQLLLLSLANHCLRLVFRNAAGFQPFLTNWRSRVNPCPCAAL